jgi:hypothetical protein
MSILTPPPLLPNTQPPWAALHGATASPRQIRALDHVRIDERRAGQHMLTLSRYKDKDSSDRSDDCVVAIWDVDTLAVAACGVHHGPRRLQEPGVCHAAKGRPYRRRRRV